MGKPPKYFIVEASALPEIFRKVAEAKRLLELGEAETVHQATEMVGISRSAFYKYKDAVRPFNDMLHGRIVTFQVRLRDEPGVLSSVLNSFALSGANIRGGDLRPPDPGGGAFEPHHGPERGSEMRDSGGLRARMGKRRSV